MCKEKINGRSSIARRMLTAGAAGLILAGPIRAETSNESAETGAANLETQERRDLHRLEDLTVHLEQRDLLLEPTLESPALEPARGTITSEELEIIQPFVADDVLKAAPHIHTETRGRKYKTFHSFRGQKYPYPDALFDGIWHREASDTFNIYPGAMIERVEIMRSPATLFHGLSDVVGGINVITRKPEPAADAPAEYRVGTEVGEYGTARGYAFGEFPVSETQAFAVGGQYFRTDGAGRNDAEEISSMFGSYVFQPEPDHRFEAGGWLLHGFRELERPDPDGPASNNLKNRKERYSPMTYGHINLQGKHKWSDATTSDWKVYYTDRQARYKREKIDPDGPGPGDTEADEDDREYGAQFIQSVALSPNNTLRFGGFLHRWTAPEGKKRYAGDRQDIGSYALVIADEQRVGDWTFDVGLRYARSYFYDFTNPAFDVQGTHTTAETVRNHWDNPILSGTAGVTYALNELNSLYAHGGAGQRRPGPGAVEPDGTSPDTEKRYTADVGWEMLWGRDGRLQLGGFGILRDDAITRVSTDPLPTDEEGNEFYFSGNRNIRQYGMELELETPRLWNERLSFFGALTWMRSEAVEDGRYEKYREIPSIVKTAGMNLEEGRWDGSVRMKHVDRYENFRFAQDGEYHSLGDYWDVGLTAGYRAGRKENIRIYGAVDNLLDDEYSTVVGWSDPGITFRAGLEAKF